MKTKIQIKHWITRAVLFEFEKENNTIKDTLEEAVRAYADLSYADLRYADLRSVNLRSANLRSADLRYADLSYADLSYANLSYVDLRSADLSYVDLSYADLSSANLSYAKNINSDATDYWWHIHHETLYEWLTEPVRARINYIKKEKAKNETPEQIKLRLKLLKPVLGDIPEDKKGWEKLHKKECGCGWDGRTIFTEKNNYKKSSKVDA